MIGLPGPKSAISGLKRRLKFYNSMDIIGTVQSAVRRYQVTILLAEILVLWWLFQVFSYRLWLNGPTYKWLFTFQQLSQTTPGWFLSIISHALDPFAHLVPNLAMLLVFGALSEPHLKTRDYLIFFTVVGFISSPVHLYLFQETSNVAGASGPIFGFVMYGTYHYVWEHSDRLSFDSDASYFRSVFSIAIFLLPIAAVVMVVLQLLGMWPRGASAVESHALGLFAGFLLVYLQPAFSTLPCRENQMTGWG